MLISAFILFYFIADLWIHWNKTKCFCVFLQTSIFAAAANHVPPTQRVTVTSYIMRHCMLLHSLYHVLRLGKLRLTGSASTSMAGRNTEPARISLSNEHRLLQNSTTNSLQYTGTAQWWGAGVVICLQWGADLHMAQLMTLPLTVSCFSKIQIGFTFWYRLTRVIPDKGPLNGCVCVCVCAQFCNITTAHLHSLMPNSKPAVTGQYLLPEGCSAANPLAAIAWWDRQTDRQTNGRYTDPAPHSKHTASVTKITKLIITIMRVNKMLHN